MADVHHEEDGLFARLWVKSQPALAAYVRSMVHQRADAEDLIQNIAAEAMVDFKSFDRGASFTAWVMGIARYRILNYYRTARRDRHIFDAPSMERLAEAHERLSSQTELYRDALEHCLNRLPERQRAMVAMRYGDELGREQIAERLKTTASAVAMALTRIRRALATCIETRIASERTRG
ncbi:MAG: sigma-70 family RNA polymerase sigma factor [Planctomycetes bacterium]|nr:sigma-70 family RNA polymerase sigma factor [Planctomycetota bacterium]